MSGTSDSLDTISNKLRDIIVNLGGNIGELKNLGMKDFRRAVNKKFPAGEYVQIFFSSDTNVPAGIKEKLKLDKTVNRTFIEVV